MVTVNIRGGGAGSSQNDTSPAVIIIPGWDESSNPEERLFQALSEVINSCESAPRLLPIMYSCYYKGKLRNVLCNT